MKAQRIAFHGLDPLLFGDGRPFAVGGGAGQASTLDMPFPSTVAGALRTLVGNLGHLPFTPENAVKLKAMAVRGPLMMRGDEILYRAPADAALRQLEGAPDKEWGIYRIRPTCSGEGGSDLPEGLRLALEPFSKDFKEQKSPELRWLSATDMATWLANDADLPKHFNEEKEDKGKPTSPPKDRRAHVGIAFGTQAAAKSMLYQTEGIALGQTHYEYEGVVKAGPAFSLLAEIETDQDLGCGVIALGGERRLSLYEPTQADLDCPANVRNALSGAKGVRMVLATPAAFKEGWTPGWAAPGIVPGCPDTLKLKLVSACVPRRQAVSGWDLQAGRVKQVRWLAPAGSVYFFEVVEGDPAQLADRWLRSVSDLDDNQQDQKDGFGLALWGVWNPSETTS